MTSYPIEERTVVALGTAVVVGVGPGLGVALALHPSKEYASLSVGKAALRAYVQVLHGQQAGTRVHATIVTITKGIGSEPRFRGSARPGVPRPAPPARG